MSRKRLKRQISHKKQFQIYFSVSQPPIFLKGLCLSGRYGTRLQWEQGEMSSHSLVWGLKEENISQNYEKKRFSQIKHFQIFFPIYHPLIVFKCLCLSGRYATRLQWEQGEMSSHSLVWGFKEENMSRKLRKLAIFSDKAISNIFSYTSASYFLEMFMSIR